MPATPRQTPIGHKPIAQLRLNPAVVEESADDAAPPGSTSTLEEVSMAVEENALDRGVLLLNMMAALQRLGIALSGGQESRARLFLSYIGCG